MVSFIKATPDYAEQIAEIVYETSAGVAAKLFDKLIPGVSGKTILGAAFGKGENAYSTKNVILSLHQDKVVALLFAYHAREHRTPALMESLLPAKRINAVRPVLEQAEPESLYINTIWVDESLRSKGVGKQIIKEAARLAKRFGVDKISLFCWNDNEQALAFYNKNGFEVTKTFPQEALPLEGHDLGGSILCKQLEK